MIKNSPHKKRDRVPGEHSRRAREKGVKRLAENTKTVALGFRY